MAKRIPFAAATPYPSIGAMEFGEYIPENFLNEACYRLSLFLEDGGYLSSATPSGRDITNFRVEEEGREPKVFLQGSFDLRLAAVKAGVGEIGANNCLITPKYGSRVRLCAVFTEARLAPDTPNQYGSVPEFAMSAAFVALRPAPRTRSRARARWITTAAWSYVRIWSHRRRPSPISKTFQGQAPHHGGQRTLLHRQPTTPMQHLHRPVSHDQGRELATEPFTANPGPEEDALKVIDPSLLENT